MAANSWLASNFELRRQKFLTRTLNSHNVCCGSCQWYELADTGIVFTRLSFFAAAHERKEIGKKLKCAISKGGDF